MFLDIKGAIEEHSGYEFPFPLMAIKLTGLVPLAVTSRFHDFHHSNVEGNYGLVFGF